MYPTKCGACDGPVVVSQDRLTVELRGETVGVDGIAHGRCTGCGEVFLGLEAGQRLQLAAVQQLRAARGLLLPEEIRDLRRSLGLSQAALEDLLGVGPKTVVRWEKGVVFQSATADRLMRLLRALPEVRSMLAGGELNAPSRNSSRTRRRLASK